MTFPDLDEHDTPKQKLPNCPRCGDDELGVIHPGYMMCYACGWEMYKDDSPSSTLSKRVDELVAEVNRSPLCSKCGSTMAHYRLHGYRCMNWGCPGMFGGMFGGGE